MKTLSSRIEALLFTRDDALSCQVLAEVFSVDEVEIEQAILQLHQHYQESAMELVQIKDGWRLQLKNEYFDEIKRLATAKPPKYSRSFWETLSYIAYYQPVTRAEIDHIRGVSTSSHIYRQLFDLEWVTVSGRKEVPGKPELLSTTRQFLDDFSIKSIDELPELPDLLVEGDANNVRE